MPAWLVSMATHYVLGIIVSHLHEMEGKIDWVKLEAEVDAKILSLPFGSLVDGVLVKYAHDSMVFIKSLLEGPLIATLLELLVKGDYDGALAALKQAIQGPIPAEALK